MVAPFRSGCQKPPTFSPQQENVKSEPKEKIKEKRRKMKREREKKKKLTNVSKCLSENYLYFKNIKIKNKNIKRIFLFFPF